MVPHPPLGVLDAFDSRQKEDTMIMTLVTNALWLGFLAMFFMLCLATTRQFRSELEETDKRMREIISED